MITPITATFPALNFPKEVDYPTQEDWAAFSAAAELNYGILSGTWSDKSEEFKEQINNLALEIQEIGENAFNAISLDTIEDLATYTGTGLVMVKDLNRGGTFIYDATQSAVNNGGTIFNGWVRQYSGAVNVKWFGAKGDYKVDGVISSIYTDNYQPLINAFSLATKYKNCNFIVPEGDYYVSEEIVINHTIDNIWLYPEDGTSRLTILGSGLTNTSFYFPSNVKNGFTFGASTSYTNIGLKGFSVFRIGFNTDDYSAISVPDTLIMSESNLGHGLKIKGNGYHGYVEDICIDGFYIGLRITNSYAGNYSKIKVPMSIYGVFVESSTTNRFDDCDVKGLQACFASKSGNQLLTNVVTEGTLGFFNTSPSLMDKFKGHGVYAYSSTIQTRLSYSEKLVGYSKGMMNGSTLIEHGSITSTALNYLYNSSPLDIGNELKAKIDIYNPNKISHYFEKGAFATRSRIENSYVTIDDRIHIVDNAPTNFTNILEIVNSLPVSINLENTISKVFTGKIPASLTLPVLIDTSIVSKTQESTRVVGRLDVTADYYSNYDGNVIFNIGRITSATDRSVKKELKGVINLDGSVTFSTTAASSIVINSSGSVGLYQILFPKTDNTITLGIPSYRWSTIYAGTGTINTSDDREKTYRDITEAETLVAKELKNLMKSFRFNDSIEEKGVEKARIHYGTSAQSVKATFEKHGLVAEDYAILCHDEWEAEYEQVIDVEAELDEDGNVIKEATYKNGDLIREAGDRYGIRYEELLCFIISAM